MTIRNLCYIIILTAVLFGAYLKVLINLNRKRRLVHAAFFHVCLRIRRMGIIMIRVAVCDDDTEFLNIAEKSFKDFNHKKSDDMRFDYYFSAESFLNAFEENPYDIVFLDIEMPVFCGFSIIERLKAANENVIVIFVSNHENYVFRSFVYRPLRFIRKRNFNEEFEEALLAAADVYYELARFINIPSEGEIISQRLSEIVYFDAYSHNVHMHTASASVVVCKSLRMLEDDFSKFGFIRIHKSYLINYKYIYSVKTATVVLTTGEELPLSKHRAKEVKEQFVRFTKKRVET